MEKYLLSPKMTGAFSSEVMHRVVLNSIDFELPDNVWDVIDDAFGNYWNVEVGYGGWPDFNSAVSSVSSWVQKENYLISIDRIATIVDIMFDWIEQIPGATLDDSEIVIPHSCAEEEQERQMLKRLIKEHGSNDPNVFSLPASNFNDTRTDFVYISDKLKEFYPETYRRLTKLLDMMEIAWAEAEGTKDIWIRDYMPIQLGEREYLVYRYDPDYLKGTSQKYIMNMDDVRNVCSSILKLDDFDGQRITHSRLDGGNVVTIGKYRVLTEKVFKENGRKPDDVEFQRHLEFLLKAPIIIIPWHCNNPDDPNADVYGHSDGMVKWTGGNHVLMSNYRDFDPEEADEIRRRLENAGFEVTEMLYDVPHPNRDFNWAYINYLEVGDVIIVPTFGIPEDAQALKYIREANPYSIVQGFRMRDIARNGGALHCITWNIRR